VVALQRYKELVSAAVAVQAVAGGMDEVIVTVAEESNCCDDEQQRHCVDNHQDDHIAIDSVSTEVNHTTTTTEQPVLDLTPARNLSNTTPLRAAISPSAADPTSAFKSTKTTPLKLKPSTMEQPSTPLLGDACMEDVDDEASAGVRQRAMYARFRSWTLHNYGESGKTKTVTRSKYERVVALLSGAEPPTADNSKLRFWIKAKGFRLGYPLQVDTNPPSIINRNELYIPSKNWVRTTICC